MSPVFPYDNGQLMRRALIDARRHIAFVQEGAGVVPVNPAVPSALARIFAGIAEVEAAFGFLPDAEDVRVDRINGVRLTEREADRKVAASRPVVEEPAILTHSPARPASSWSCPQHGSANTYEKVTRTGYKYGECAVDDCGRFERLLLR